MSAFTGILHAEVMTVGGNITKWQWVTAAVVEGLCFLPALALRGVEFVAVWRLATVEIPPLSVGEPLLWTVAASWLAQATLLPPLTLGRLAWYSRWAMTGKTPPLGWMGCGFRRWGAAIRWRGAMWWRRLTVLCLAMVPTAVLWGIATLVQPLAALGLATAGALLLMLTAGLGLLRQGCATAPAGVLVLAGYPAGAAMSLASRVMAGHKRRYINAGGRYARRWTACLLVLPAPFLIPGMRLGHTAWLYRRVQTAGVTVFDAITLPLGKKSGKIAKTQNSSCKVPQSGVQ